MNTLYRILCLVIVLLSTMGFAIYITLRWRIRIEFSPAIVVSLIAVAMLISGLLNIMLFATYAILLIGIFLFFYSVVTFPHMRKILLSPSIILLIAFGVYMSWRLYGLFPTHYDNFSHWMLVLKHMIMYDSLPSFKSDIIIFKAYPTGTAGFMYFVLRIVGFREDLALLSQTVMMFAFFLPVLAFTEKKKLQSWLVIAMMFLVMMSRLSVFATLLVDDLLAFCGLGAIAIVMYYREDLRLATFCVMPICIFLVLIKNSGFFFVILVTVLLVLLAAKQNEKEQIIRIFLYTIGLPLIVYFLWGRHVTFAFVDGMTSKHALNLSSYLANFSTQTTSTLTLRFAEIMERMFSPRDKNVRSLALLFLIALLVQVLSHPYEIIRAFRKWLRSIISLLAVYLLWGISLVALYSTSMTGYEAETLAGLSRYLDTIFLFMHGGIFLGILVSLSNTEKHLGGKRQVRWAKVIGLIMSIVIALSVFSIKNLDQIRIKGKPTGDRITIRKFFQGKSIPAGGRVLVLSDSGRYDYLYYLARYEFWTSQVKAAQVNDEESLKKELVNAKQYDYVLVHVKTEALRDVLVNLPSESMLEEKVIVL